MEKKTLYIMACALAVSALGTSDLFAMGGLGLEAPKPVKKSTHGATSTGGKKVISRAHPSVAIQKHRIGVLSPKINTTHPHAGRTANKPVHRHATGFIPPHATGLKVPGKRVHTGTVQKQKMSVHTGGSKPNGMNTAGKTGQNMKTHHRHDHHHHHHHHRKLIQD